MSDGIEPKRYLITIGAPSCDAMGLKRLEQVKSDVEDVVRLFGSQGYTHVLQSNIKLTTTAPKIKSAIRDWFKEPSRQPSDHVVIYYAGHAGRVGKSNDYCLYAIDSDEEDDDSLIEIKQLVKSFYLRKDQNHPRNVLFILDACYAGAGGDAISEALGSLSDSSPEGGFWIICAAGSHDQAIDGSFVAALKSVLSSNNSKLSEDEFISPDTFINGITEYFGDRYDEASTREDRNRWKQRCQGSAIRYADQAKFIRNPHFSVIPIAENSLNHSVARALQTIDFKVQQDIFNDFLEGDRLSDVFFLEVSNDDSGELQKCLVSRLGGLLTGGNSPAFKMTQVQRRWQRETTSQLCEWLAAEFRLSPEASLGEVHEQLIQLCQTQSVFIVLYGAPLMKDSGISTMLQGFWKPLQEKLASGNSTVCQGKLILLLAGSTPMPTEVLPMYQNSDGKEYNHYLKLDVILKPDIHEWSRLPQIKPLINQLCGPNHNLSQLYQDQLSQTPGANACDAMQIVCEVLGFRDGLTNFQEYWTLSGDLVR
jgi:hypothetical protein